MKILGDRVDDDSAEDVGEKFGRIGFVSFLFGSSLPSYVAYLQGFCSRKFLNLRSQVGSFSGEPLNLELKPWQRKCSR